MKQVLVYLLTFRNRKSSAKCSCLPEAVFNQPQISPISTATDAPTPPHRSMLAGDPGTPVPAVHMLQRNEHLILLRGTGCLLGRTGPNSPSPHVPCGGSPAFAANLANRTFINPMHRNAVEHPCHRRDNNNAKKDLRPPRQISPFRFSILKRDGCFVSAHELLFYNFTPPKYLITGASAFTSGPK